MKDCNSYNSAIPLFNPITQVAGMPYPLYLSLQGKYFVGYADELDFKKGKIAWAGLINPPNSGVNLFVYVWTVSNIGQAPLIAEAWLNTDPPGCPKKSQFVTPSNTAITPLPIPKIKLLEASNIIGEVEGGDKLFTKEVTSEVTIVGEENGKFIIPPRGSFIITLSSPSKVCQAGDGRIAFGWAEEKICDDRK